MALDGLLVLACALLGAGPAAKDAPKPTAPQPDPVTNTLAVQLAFQKGRDLLLQGDTKAAVLVLEEHLPRINGNRQYLMLLRDAYREYLKELSLKNQTDEAAKYAQRLRILAPNSVPGKTDLKSVPPEAVPSATAPTKTNTAPSRPHADGPGKNTPKYRGQTDDPFHPDNENKDLPKKPRRQKSPPGSRAREKKRSPAEGEKEKAARQLVAQAEEEFSKRRFDRAHLLFEQAHQKDERTTAKTQDQWAYCKLHRVVENMNQAGAEKPNWSELEREVQAALRMAPRLDATGKWILKEIEQRRQGAGSQREGKDGSAPVRVQHLSRNGQGWDVAETANFRIFHNQSREWVNKAARVAEQTRTAMNRKWFGTAGDNWNPKCDLYLHADGKQYSRLTGVPANSPGHSRIETDGERVVSRRIDVHCDNANVVAAVLPHETTHVVLAGKFGKHPVPRWADEGIAVLTEPADKVDLHRKNLARCQQDGQLFQVKELMQLNDYPQPRRIGAFYAQSVSLVDYLAKKRGAVVFSQFLREALRDGYEPALKKHYNFRSFEELQESWSQEALEKPKAYAAGKKRYGR